MLLSSERPIAHVYPLLRRIYYSGLVDMIESGYNRPNIPEYPQIAEHIKQALDDVYNGLKEPKQALDDAAVKSAKALGW